MKRYAAKRTVECWVDERLPPERSQRGHEVERNTSRPRIARSRLARCRLATKRDPAGNSRAEASLSKSSDEPSPSASDTTAAEWRSQTSPHQRFLTERIAFQSRQQAGGWIATRLARSQSPLILHARRSKLLRPPRIDSWASELACPHHFCRTVAAGTRGVSQRMVRRGSPVRVRKRASIYKRVCRGRTCRAGGR